MVSTRSSPRSAARPAWSHTPTRLTLLWLAVSLVLVAWDTGYVLLRPHTMEGGFLHKPLWVPYKLYGAVDYVYGWRAWEERNGFTGAQGAMNLVESCLYGAYLWLWGRGRDERGAVTGREGGLAVLLGWAAAVMTLSKTMLYWLNEYFSGFDNIGHNPPQTLFFLWIIPNGAWLVLPTYMIYAIGSDILDAFALASRTKDE
ncbi:hypothetical protein VUR80DRAFT_10255 [Thermomyces stellatus]